MTPSSWQWQGAGQAAGPGLGWGALGETQSVAHSHSAHSPGARGIVAAGAAPSQGPPRGLCWGAAAGRGDGVVRVAQASPNASYSASQAGLGKGGRPRRRRSQGNVCAAARSPSLLPSSWQGFRPGEKRAARIPKTASRASLSASDLHLFGTRSQGLLRGQPWGHTGWDVREALNRSSRSPTCPSPQEETETPEGSHC